jgi:hypothetical protein
MANEQRKAELDRRISELEEKLGVVGDRTLEGEMGWFDYAVHGDRSGIEAAASRALQKRQQAEATEEQRNRAMKALQDAQADYDALGPTSSSSDRAKAEAALDYYVKEARRLGLEEGFVKPYDRSQPKMQQQGNGEAAQTEEKMDAPKQAGRTPLATISLARKALKNDEVNEDEVNGIISELKAIPDDEQSRDLVNELIAGLENKLASKKAKDAGVSAAETIRIIGKAGVSKDEVIAEQKKWEAMPKTKEQQEVLAKIEKKLSTFKKDPGIAEAANNISFFSALDALDRKQGKISAMANDKNYNFDIVDYNNGTFGILHNGKLIRKIMRGGNR